MGRGDKRSTKGKIFRGSFGNRRAHGRKKKATGRQSLAYASASPERQRV